MLASHQHRVGRLDGLGITFHRLPRVGVALEARPITALDQHSDPMPLVEHERLVAVRMDIDQLDNEVGVLRIGADP